MCAVCVLLGVVLGVQCDLSTCIGCVSHLNNNNNNNNNNNLLLLLLIRFNQIHVTHVHIIYMK